VVISGGDLGLMVNGAASLEANGRVDRLTARLNGAGSMDLSRLVAANAIVESNGAGTITVNVTGSLDARVNGVGTIRYRGGPTQVSTAINGVGSIAAE
jgi:Putative auto-transporter adhesin, head GIN domain